MRTKLTLISILIFSALIFTACGSKSGLEIKYDGQQLPFETKSAWITTQEALYGSKSEKHALRWIVLRNFEYEVKDALSANAGKLTEPGQIRLFLSIREEMGTNPNTPIKVSTFSGDKDGAMSFDFLNLTFFKDGKEEVHTVSLGTQTNRQDSEVKILSLTDDTIKGEVKINVKESSGKFLTVSGPFTAKIFKSK